jgi:hypothetical protein
MREMEKIGEMEELFDFFTFLIPSSSSPPPLPYFAR